MRSDHRRVRHDQAGLIGTVTQCIHGVGDADRVGAGGTVGAGVEVDTEVGVEVSSPPTRAATIRMDANSVTRNMKSLTGPSNHERW